MSETLTKEQKLARFPKDENFEITDTIGFPHPYCITPRHVAWASDHWNGMLGEAAIEDAEKNGAACDICRKQGKDLKYRQHEQGLVVECKTNDQKLLGKYLESCKALAQEMNFAGFALLDAATKKGLKL